MCSTIHENELNKIKEELLFPLGIPQRLDKQFSELRREFAYRERNGHETDQVFVKLRKLGNTRENIAKEHDRVLVRQLLDYISELSKK